MALDIGTIRNIGISAHIDSGKTTLTERILYYTRRIHAMHEVKGGDGVGATMDFMDLERERGITISSAATYCSWNGHHINVIDTPGHVDFTIEVERALRVLDGAILVLCGVGGVQSQSLSVDRQMRRYGVPRLAFVNKCDRVGANPLRVVREIREKLQINPVLLQLPIGLEEHFEGLIDLIQMRALRFEGKSGAEVVSGPIPDELLKAAQEAREEMLDSVSMFSDELTEAILEDRVTPAVLNSSIRKCVVELKLVPVLLGSAYRNKGVQPLLDAVVAYLPAPGDVVNTAIDLDNGEQEIELPCDPAKATVALAFKLEDSRYGQLTYLRVYSGRLGRDGTLYNARTRKKHRIGRLVRMHANSMEDIQEAVAGDIVAIFGIDCLSGDTFTDGKIAISMSSMHIPNPVISLSVHAADHASETNMVKALQRFTKEDPTFRASVDAESSETVIHGMGELHLDIYLERMRREYNVALTTSPPQVAYRETVTRVAEFNYTHRKQTGGAGQFGRVAGRIEPLDAGEFEFVDRVAGGAIPRNFMSSVEKGFRSLLSRGPLIGSPLTQVRVTVDDGASHPVDSSDIAFQEAARGAFREALARSAPRILEPIMKVAVEGPPEFAGSVLATLHQRRGTIIGSQEEAGLTRIEAEVPLAAMFGYATTLRSCTEGKAEFTMEFARYLPVPESIRDDLIEQARKRKAQGGNRP